METLSQAEFEEYVMEEETPSIVLFSRKSCHVCQAVHPMLEDLEGDYPGVKFYHVDVEDEPGLFQKYGGKGVPQVISFRGGEPVKRLAGQQEEDSYIDQIEEIQ
jgi:thioredoxin 1